MTPRWCDTTLVTAFARIYGPFRGVVEQTGMEYEEDELMVCTWGVPGAEPIEAFSGGLTVHSSGL